MIAAIDDIRQRSWDFALTLITVALLAILGVQSFIGTFVVWWAIRTIPNWQTGPGYTSYVAMMNTIAAPLIVGLVVVMGLCVPKRLFARRVLLWVSVAMVAVGVMAGLAMRSLADGLAIYLLLSAAIQLAVVVMTIAGVRGPTYLTEGRLTKVGSGLLHLGFIVFAVVVVALQKSQLMLPVFSVAALLVTGGTALSFYASKFAWHRPLPEADDDEAPIEWDAEENGDSAAVDEQPAPHPGDVAPPV
jgi:hypothetical protein